MSTTIRYSAFPSKRAYKKFMKQLNKSQKSNKIRVVRCRNCFNSHATIQNPQLVGNWKVAKIYGLVHFVDPNGVVCTSQQFDQIMGVSQ